MRAVPRNRKPRRRPLGSLVVALAALALVWASAAPAGAAPGGSPADCPATDLAVTALAQPFSGWPRGVVVRVDVTNVVPCAVAVAHANGVDFLMEGAKDRNGSPFAATVAALVNRGVKFEVCEITLKNRNLKKEQFIQEADFTPSGVVRLVKLQKQGYSYIRP